MKIIAIRMLLCLSLVLLALPTNGGSALEARVYPLLAFAPCDVVVQAFIEPDTRNRSIEFILDSESLYTSSTVDLDGDRAPRTKEVRFRSLPAGVYQARVRLNGANGERGSAVRRVDVISTSAQPQ